ncbi:hypothetical protein MCOR02_008221 [Pyricularia oryzae]|nr:hypothetical protein MCOR02_008221 [Pyricularia oryzae]
MRLHFFTELLAAGSLLLSSVNALEAKLTQQEDKREKCVGMYSRSAWGGDIDPFILVRFNKVEEEGDHRASMLIFEWMDQDLVLFQSSPDTPRYKLAICNPENVSAGNCNETHLGEYIVSANVNKESHNIVHTQVVDLKDPKPFNYPIKNTGYYCIFTAEYTRSDYEAIVEFRNAFGELPAAQIPKLPFYGGITILYALVAVFWGLLYYRHRSDILPVQNYITAILIFLVVEMLLTWAFYDYLNRHGSNTLSKFLLVLVAVLNAIRNSFSFFLLLIVCMGYGVVKHTLGKTMIYVRYLAIAHFFFGLVYAVASLVITPDSAGPFVLLIVLPLAGTLTAFYVWTLNSLNLTLKELNERKQHVKEGMYKKLWWCILISIIVIFGFFFFSSFSFTSMRDPDYVPFHWKTRWFMLDGWLNLVYFADVAFIAYVWRPTANNRRFAMSDEIAQEDDGTFDMTNMDIGAPDDSDDEEANIGTKPATSTHTATQTNGGAPSNARSGPTATRNAGPAARDSLDGETIFAVGEDLDKFSDDDEDSEEERGLVKKSNK